MSRYLLILASVIFIAMPTASARMYQWIDPDNGTSQLSGKPPVWYRSVDGGPRVFVFERGGEMIDDTARQVSDDERKQLRQQAFIKAEEDIQIAKEKMIQAKRLAATYQHDEESEEEVIQEEVIAQPRDPEAADAPAEPVPDEQIVNEMRAMILQWERTREANARALVE